MATPQSSTHRTFLPSTQLLAGSPPAASAPSQQQTPEEPSLPLPFSLLFFFSLFSPQQQHKTLTARSDTHHTPHTNNLHTQTHTLALTFTLTLKPAAPPRPPPSSHSPPPLLSSLLSSLNGTTMPLFSLRRVSDSSAGSKASRVSARLKAKAKRALKTVGRTVRGTLPLSLLCILTPHHTVSTKRHLAPQDLARGPSLCNIGTILYID